MVDGLIGIPKNPINPAVITNGKIFGNGEKDIEVAYTCSNPKSSWNRADQYTYSCRDGNRTKPSIEANNAANTLKNGN